MLALAFLCGVRTVEAQITPSDDACTDTAKPATNFGKAVTLAVSSSQTGYITEV